MISTGGRSTTWLLGLRCVCNTGQELCGSSTLGLSRHSDSHHSTIRESNATPGQPTGRLVRMDSWLADHLGAEDPVARVAAVSHTLAELG